METINFVNNSQPYINADNLNEIQDNVENAIADAVTDVNENIDTAKQEVLDLFNFSTTEKEVGKWIDGKPIYKKVFSIEVGSSADIRYTHNLSNLSTFWINQADSFIFGNSESLSLNYYYSSTDWARAWINDTTIRIRVASSSFGSRTAYVVVEYTKTTD